MKSTFTFLFALACFSIMGNTAYAQMRTADSDQKTKTVQSKAAKTKATTSKTAKKVEKEVKISEPAHLELKGGIKVALKAPPSLESKEIVEYMSEGQKPGIKVPILGVDFEDAIKSWQSHIKQFDGKTKNKKDNTGQYFFTDNAVMSDLSDNTVDLYSSIEKTASGLYLKTFFDLGGAYLSSKTHPEAYEKALSMVKSFAKNESVKAYEDKVALEEMNLRKIDAKRKDQQTLHKAIQDDISYHKEALKKAEAALIQNSRTQDAQNIEAEKQISVVEQVKSDLKGIESQN